MKWQLLTAIGLSLTYSCQCFVQYRQSISSLAAFEYHQSRLLAVATSRAPVSVNQSRRQNIECKRSRGLIIVTKASEQDSDTGDDLKKEAIDNTISLSELVLSKSYVLCKYLFTATSLMIFSTPDRSLGTMLLQQWSGGAGYACAAALWDILHTANANGLQGSDTYKRLHIGLALFSIINLFAVPGEAGFFLLSHQRIVFSLLTGIRILGATTALWGWNASLKKPALKELTTGIVGTLKGLRVVDRKKALSYRNSMLLVVATGISSFLQGRFLLSYQKEFLTTNFEISLKWSAVARLSMLATMIFTLKDAAERDRLGGTTFIQLNTLVGLVAVAAGMGQASYPSGAAARRGILFFFFSGLFFLRAYRGKLSKQLEKK